MLQSEQLVPDCACVGWTRLGSVGPCPNSGFEFALGSRYRFASVVPGTNRTMNAGANNFDYSDPGVLGKDEIWGKSKIHGQHAGGISRGGYGRVDRTGVPAPPSSPSWLWRER